MTNWNLIDEAVALVIEYYEANQIMEQTSSITSRTIEWYNKTEIVDPYTLAAQVISGTYPTPFTTYEDIVACTNFYYAEAPSFEIPIWEIEDSYHNIF